MCVPMHRRLPSNVASDVPTNLAAYNPSESQTEAPGRNEAILMHVPARAQTSEPFSAFTDVVCLREVRDGTLLEVDCPLDQHSPRGEVEAAAGVPPSVLLMATAAADSPSSVRTSSGGYELPTPEPDPVVYGSLQPCLPGPASGFSTEEARTTRTCYTDTMSSRRKRHGTARRKTASSSKREDTGMKDHDRTTMPQWEGDATTPREVRASSLEAKRTIKRVSCPVSVLAAPRLVPVNGLTEHACSAPAAPKRTATRRGSTTTYGSGHAFSTRLCLMPPTRRLQCTRKDRG